VPERARLRCQSPDRPQHEVASSGRGPVNTVYVCPRWLPVGFALAGAKADERETLLGILAADPDLAAMLPGQTLIADKNYFGRDFEAALAAEGAHLLRPARQGEPERPGAQFFKPLRQIIESVNATFKGQLDLEHHGGATPQPGSSCACCSASSP
jgi:hypothetical protein